MPEYSEYSEYSVLGKHVCGSGGTQTWVKVLVLVNFWLRLLSEGCPL